MLLTTKHLQSFAPFGVWTWLLGPLLSKASAHTEAAIAGPKDLGHDRNDGSAGGAYGDWKPGGADGSAGGAYGDWKPGGADDEPGPLYCNVTHAGSITTYDLAIANIIRLTPLGNLPCDRNPGCARVACVDDSAVIVCNDSPARVRPAYSLVVEYAMRIILRQEDGGCTFWGPGGALLVNGQLFNATDGWNVIVAGQDCCGTAMRTCGPFPSAGVPN